MILTRVAGADPIRERERPVEIPALALGARKTVARSRTVIWFAQAKACGLVGC